MRPARLIQGDCIEVMRGAKQHSIDSIVTDPPYGIEFAGNEWDSPQRMVGMSTGANGGFHNLPVGTPRPDMDRCDPQLFQQWCTAWGLEAMRVLKPGGHLLAFGGTRMYHRLVAGLEDAGFEIRDMIGWIHGQGFPKAKQIAGHEGWKTPCLKPAIEPIVVARAPRKIPGKRAGTMKKATTKQNMDEHGVGGYNIDAVRIGDEEMVNPGGMAAWNVYRHGQPYVEGGEASTVSTGRFPANVMLDEIAAAEMDAQSGVSTSGAAGTKGSSGFVDGYDGEYEVPYGDTGGASRFFYVSKPGPEERKAGLDEKNSHPTQKPKRLMLELARLVTPEGGQVLDPFMGSGTTGVAAIEGGFRFIGIEQDAAYLSIAQQRIDHAIQMIQEEVPA